MRTCGSELHPCSANSGDYGGGAGVGGVGINMYIRLRTQSLEEDSQMTPASAEISCPISIIISSGGPVMVRFPLHSTPFYSQLRPRAPLRVLLSIKCVTKLLGYKREDKPEHSIWGQHH